MPLLHLRRIIGVHTPPLHARLTHHSQRPLHVPITRAQQDLERQTRLPTGLLTVPSGDGEAAASDPARVSDVVEDRVAADAGGPGERDGDGHEVQYRSEFPDAGLSVLTKVSATL